MKLIVTFIIVSSIIVGISSMRCFHCVGIKYFMSPSDWSEAEGHPLPALPENFPFPHHKSCQFGEDPDEELSIECENEAPIVADSLGDIAKEYDIGEFESKVQELVDSAKGASFACTTMKFSEHANVDGRPFEIETTFRSCYPDHRNVTTDLRTFGNMNESASGYICNDSDNCNADGKVGMLKLLNANAHHVLPEPELKSIGHGIISFSPYYLIAITSLPVLLQFS